MEDFILVGSVYGRKYCVQSYGDCAVRMSSSVEKAKVGTYDCISNLKGIIIQQEPTFFFDGRPRNDVIIRWFIIPSTAFNKF